MPVTGPGTPSDAIVNEALEKVLELLKREYDCLRFEATYWSRKDRIERINKLKAAIYDMLELEYWESW